MNKYDYNTSKARIIRLLRKKACSLDEIILVESSSSSQLTGLILDLEKKGLVHCIWKFEKFSKHNKPYTKMRKIYFSSISSQLSHKRDNIVSAIKPCRTINLRT